jgi:hypothetical protein
MRRADIEVPNLPVDVNSWGRSACYPRGSFCPLSHGPSTQCRRITLPDFRPCSTCRSHSQAPLCQYTQRTVSIRAEGTFGRLRYLLGGDRPSQTAHLALSQTWVRLELEPDKSGISPSALPRLAPRLLSLPPILHMPSPNSVPGYSKAPRGLFVQWREEGIFTPISISPSPSLRQRPCCYTFRAGRNLPDKGLRYLRTVIVTAAAYRGFRSRLHLTADLSL